MPLRTEPVQARSSARLRALLDATAAMIDEVGLERVTTNLIAERAGSSIGTLYRYFPDRIAVLRGLALRHASTLREDLQREIQLVSPDERGLGQALIAFAGRYLERSRTEPGWVAVSFGHALDIPLAAGEEQLVDAPLRGSATPRAQLARDVAIRFSDDESQMRALASDIEVYTVLVQALVDRAFATGRAGDPALIEVATETLQALAHTTAEAHRVRRAGGR